jgi:hypothetical protein
VLQRAYTRDVRDLNDGAKLLCAVSTY